MKQNKTTLYTFLVLLLMISVNINAQNKSSNQQIEEVETVEETEQPEAVRFAFIENPPIYPGCENLKGREAKDCMSKNVTAFVSKNFNTDVPLNLGISGKVKIMTQFTIDKNGKVTNIKARSRYKELDIEAKRVISLLPKTQPGKQKGKIVKVTYVLPIVFKIEAPILTPPSYPECENLKENEISNCMMKKIQLFIANHIDLKIAHTWGYRGNKVINIKFIVDEQGNISNITAKDLRFFELKEIKRIFSLLPKMKPAKLNGKPSEVSFMVPVTIYNNDSKKEIVINEKTMPFVPTALIYPGCKQKGFIELRNCMNTKIQQFIGRNFNKNIKTEYTSKRIKILTKFTINEQGLIENIRTRSKNEEFSKEAERILKKLPQMIPATINGRKISLTFTLPIYIEL